MRTRSLLAALVAAVALASVANAQAAVELPPVCGPDMTCEGPPPLCVTQPCCSGPCPPPCDGCEPQPTPTCREHSVSTSQVLATASPVVARLPPAIGIAYNGPHAGVQVQRDCTIDVWERGLACNLSTLLPEERTLGYQVGPVEVAADVCMPDLVCTCPPVTALD